ncbi:PepSY domain-containing protein [Arenibacterium sp. LLYu02]|uniref:PepSY domain-containing protein n=1 Tax=Arenibacterium sp. LLYu02 TaxID=3404132 RepID=UPI003B21D16F
MNQTSLKTLSLATLIALSAGSAFAGLTTGDQLATTDADIRSRLEADGYTVLSIERDEAEIEVTASSAAGQVEFEISASSGVILATESGEDDHDGAEEDEADESKEDTDASEDEENDDA